MNWDKLRTAESDDSPFGEWGLYTSTEVPGHEEMLTATHLRACLDLLAEGNFGTAQGMRNDFIADDRFTPTVFSKISELRNSPSWSEIDAFMGREYRCQWLDYKRELEGAL